MYKSSGKIELLGELYQCYMDLVYGVCLKYMKDSEEAKDCVINIFEELITKLRRHEVVNFKGWLYRLTKNFCLMRLRQQKHKPVNIDISTMHLQDFVHRDYDIVKEDNLKQLEYCMARLNNEQRIVIEQFYLQSKCYKEIETFTGIEISQVRSHIQNGRRNLKICMDNQAKEQTK